MKRIQRLLSILLVCCMMLSCLPATALANEARENEYTDTEIEVSPEMAADLVAMLTGEDPGEPIKTDGGYVFDMPDSMVNDLTSAIDEASVLGEDDANILPDDYVDDSNDALYAMLEEMARTPMVLDGTLTGTKIDLFFVIDSTGSMSSYINNVKANVAEFARSIGDTGATLRLGLIDYRDITVDGDDSTTVHEPGYSPWMDVPGFIDELTTVRASGGGDTLETPIDALGNLVQSSIGWNSDAYKFAMLITDAGYKTNNNHGIADMDEMIRLLQEKNIFVSTITPTYVASDYGELAGLTGGVQIVLSSNFADDMLDFAEAVIGTVSIGSKPTRDYTLRVLDSETGLPVSGASVTWTGGSTATDDTGTAKIVSADSPVRNVKVTRAGYMTEELGDLYIDTDVMLATMTVDPDSDMDDIPMLTPSMFKNPDSGNGTLQGPTLGFLGKTFVLLDGINISLDLPIFGGVGIQTANDKDKKLFLVTIGNEAETVSDDPDSSYWKNDYPLYKSVVQTFNKDKSAKEIYNDFRTLRKNEKATSGSFALPIEFKFAGYAEVSYASGSLDSIEGGVIIGATTKEFEHVSYFPPQPWIFLKVTFQADLTGKIGLIKVESTGKKFFTLEARGLEASATATLTLNAGAKHLAYVGGGLKGTLDATLDLPIPSGKLENALTVILEGKFTVELKLLGFKASKDFGSLKAQLYPWGTGRSIDAYSLGSIDSSDFTPIGLPSPILTRSGAPSGAEFYENEVYEDSAPQLVQLQDDTWLLVWIDAVEGRSDGSVLTGLYYAYSDNDGNWSAPVLVDNDGTHDFMPALALSDDGTPVLVWQNSQTIWSTLGDRELEEIASDIELKAAVYDQISNSFKDEITISNSNGQYPAAAQVIPYGTGAAAYWIETDPSNLLLAESLTSTIYQSIWDGSTWGTPVKVDDIGSLDGFAVGRIGSSVSVAYAEGDKITVDGRALTAASIVSGLQIADGSLYWSDANGLNVWNDGYGVTTFDNLAPEDFTILTNGSQKVMLIRQYTESANELYASSYTVDGWSNPVPVTEYSTLNLSVPSAVLTDSGRIYWACGRFESATGSGSDLVVDSYAPTANVVVGDEAYISDMITAGETAYASVDLSNAGLASTSVYATVQIGDVSEPAGIYRFSEDDPDVVTQLNAGEYLDAGILFTAPAAMNGETVTITFTDVAGNILGTATGTLPAAVPDIEVTDVATDGATVTATVANIGAAPASGVSVNLTQEGVEGTLDTQAISLPAGTRQTVSFSIGAGAELTPDTRYDYKRFIVTAEPAVNEVMLGNNSDSALIAPKAVESIAINGEKLVAMKGGERLSLTCTITPADAPADVAWMSTRNSVATVDAYGTVSAWNDGEADIIVSYILDDGTVLQDKITVTVAEGTSSVTGVNGVTITPSSATVRIGETATLTAVVSPSTATDQSVTWHVENEDILRVTPGGDNTLLVEGVAAGETTVTVRTNDGAYTATASVSVIEVNDVTITFNANGGTVTPATMTTDEEGRLAWLPVPVRDGYDFDGWFTAPVSGDEITVDTVFTEDTTVYAHWTQNIMPPAPARTYTVTVYGGTGGGDYEIGEDVTITAIVPEGMRFRFWTVDEGDVTLADPYSEVTTFTMPASDVTVTATFEDAAIPPVSSTYMITFDANGGTVTPVTMTTDEEGRLAWLPVPVRDGYDFDGWFTALTGGDRVTVNTVFTGDAVVYARWTYSSDFFDGNNWYPPADSTAPTTYRITVPAVPGGTVAVSPKSAAKGRTVTLTATADEGYELASLIAEDSKGNALELTDKGDGKYTFTMPGSAVTVSAVFKLIENQPEAPIVPVWVNPFADVSLSAWYYDAVKFVNENGLMNGLSSTVFAPDANLSRAELAQILYNKEGKPAVSGGSAFTDVATSAWYSDAVTWAAANHIVGGYGNGLFGPDDNINREQLAVMLWRYTGEPMSIREISFSDADQISDFAQAAIRWAVENGILNGKGNNILDPKGFATRAEVAQMLKNYLDN